MNMIYKHQLSLVDTQTFLMPGWPVPLCAQLHEGAVCAWFLVEPGKPMRNVVVTMHSTGSPIDVYPGKHMGTVITPSGVWHVFSEIKELPE